MTINSVYLDMLNKFERDFTDKESNRTVWAMLYCNVLGEANDANNAQLVSQIAQRFFEARVVPEAIYTSEWFDKEEALINEIRSGGFNLITQYKEDVTSQLEIPKLFNQVLQIRKILPQQT